MDAGAQDVAEGESGAGNYRIDLAEVFVGEADLVIFSKFLGLHWVLLLTTDYIKRKFFQKILYNPTKCTTTSTNHYMKAVTLKLQPEIAEQTRRLKEATGFSESAILRQAIRAGLPVVASALAKMPTARPA
ncbi:MAG: CopG family transcriptional regulator [Burkholderiaceae bacterium]|nr:CopG family transcriptional regulator [Burkholderiaceae bacterium]